MSSKRDRYLRRRIERRRTPWVCFALKTPLFFIRLSPFRRDQTLELSTNL